MLERVIVGVDGSDGAAAALQWGVAEAAVHGASVTAVMVWSYMDQRHADPLADDFRPDYGETDAMEALDAAVRAALGDDHHVELRTVCDVPARGLLEASERADLTVLGARGTGGFAGLHLGSVSERVAERSGRPVAVVHGDTPVDDGPVVVGIDGSARARIALEWAAAEARARGARLEVVHAWHLSTIPSSPWMPLTFDPAQIESWAISTLESAMKDAALSGVAATSHLVQGAAAKALLDQAAGARLIVVGSRGVGGVAAALFGSVSRRVLHHASCPVVVL